MAFRVNAERNGGPTDLLERLPEIVHDELRSRAAWFIKLRWFVPFAVIFGTLAARMVGFEIVTTNRLIAIGIFILLYNTVFYLVGRRALAAGSEFSAGRLHGFAWIQVGLDYISMFLLVHFTGGIASPLIFFFIFHIIFAAILMTPLSSFVFSGLVVLGMVFIAAAEFSGWWPNYGLIFDGETINLPERPVHIAVRLLFFACSVFVTAFSTGSIMTMVKKRITHLTDLTVIISELNNRLNVLFSMVTTIGSIRHLKAVLDSVTTDLTRVMRVQGISVKLLSEDGTRLEYTAAYGLDERFSPNRYIEIKKSPLNEKVILGDPFVTGDVTPGERFQFGEDLSAADIKSVLFVPMTVDKKVIGILGAYCRQTDRFSDRDVHFFRLAAGLVAFAVDNAMAYERIETLGRERTWFMLKVAHNLKTPLSAIINMIQAIQGDFLGAINDAQKEYLRRIDRRARTMVEMINQLLSLAEKRNQTRPKKSRVDLTDIFGRLTRTFADEVRRKNLNFRIELPEPLPVIDGDPEMIEQAFENLLSNAVKYTPKDGRVSVETAVTGGKTVRVMISDSGIGIPPADLDKVFDEFFRAANTRELDETGTGLGLSIVREVVEQHGGKIHLESEEGLGTLVAVHLPIDRRP